MSGEMMTGPIWCHSLNENEMAASPDVIAMEVNAPGHDNLSSGAAVGSTPVKADPAGHTQTHAASVLTTNGHGHDTPGEKLSRQMGWTDQQVHHTCSLRGILRAL